MAASSVRIQVCGSIALEVAGKRCEQELPGPQGRRALAYLVVERHDVVTRDRLVDALWGQAPPAAADTAMHALISKIRRVVPVVVDGGQIHLDLPAGSWVDLEVARAAIHRAESSAAQGDWGRAWGAAQTALFTARRGFLADVSAAWAQSIRGDLGLLRQRALETYASAALHIGRTELATAERASRELVGLAPFRETGHRLLMQTLAAQGNVAEALRAYEVLRVQLRDELGVDPSEQTRALHSHLLSL